MPDNNARHRDSNSARHHGPDGPMGRPQETRSGFFGWSSIRTATTTIPPPIRNPGHVECGVHRSKPDAIAKATGMANWPTDIGHIDLGGRVIDVIPFPGHQEASIALYDRMTGNLMTGDSLYPGLLTVENIDALP